MAKRRARRQRSRRGFGLLSGGSKWPVLAGILGLLLLAGASGAAAAVTDTRRARVINRYAARGVHPDLQAFLDWWEQNGPFDVEIGQLDGYPGGGLRTAADAGGQAAACASGLSNACDLASTPHGRGAALDLWPVCCGFSPTLSWEQWTPEIKSAFLTIGQLAESQGLTWGGRWRSTTFPHGDQPHIELPYWRSLPYPPPDYGG